MFPAFNPRAINAHFDSKIAEHVTHVIDTVAQMNLTQFTLVNTAQQQHGANLNNRNINDGNMQTNLTNNELRLQLQNYVNYFKKNLHFAVIIYHLCILHFVIVLHFVVILHFVVVDYFCGFFVDNF